MEVGDAARRLRGGLAGDRPAGGAAQSAPPTSDNLLWNGDDPTGRSVSVRCLHGLGDTIQFSRFFPLLNASAAGLSVFVQPELVPLFQQQQGFGVLGMG